jgi:hypothetical protein
MPDRIESLMRVLHVVHLVWLDGNELSLLAFAELHLFFLLHEIARSTAAGAQAVSAAVTLEPVLLSNLSALHHLDDPLETAACQGVVSTALLNQSQ